MGKRNHFAYDPQYIAYVESGESAAVLITRDIVRSIDTEGLWIDILSHDGWVNRKKAGKWDFSVIHVELFPRRTKPQYSRSMSAEEKKYATWCAAQKDIEYWRSRGYEGSKYYIKLALRNRNEGKTKPSEVVWNTKFDQQVSNICKNNKDCVVKTIYVPVRPWWEYSIISVKRLG